MVQGWEQAAFGFTPEFQKQILATIIQEPKVFERIGVYIDPNNFEVDLFSNIFGCLQSFYKKYKGVPNYDECTELVNSYYSSNNIPKDDIVDETLKELYNHKRISGSSIEYTTNKVKDFISCQALKKAIYESIDDLGDVKNHLNVKKRIEEALNVCANLDDLGINAYSKDEILKRWRKRSEHVEIKRISTGWTEFDKIFGGYGSGELFTFLGPANAGKSMYLVNAGANILLQKKNVAHFSLEMSEEVTVQRYDMRLLGLTQEELLTNTASLRIKELLSKQIGQLRIKRFPATTVTAMDITSYLKRLEATDNFVADAVIIDYADIMRSSSRYNEKRYELDLIYQEIRNLAIEFDVPVITATQLNRAALEKLEEGKILTEENIAESYGIARVIDNGVTINATPLDNANHSSVIYVCKNRNGAAGGSMRMYVDFGKALVREWSAPSALDVKKMSNRNKLTI